MKKELTKRVDDNHTAQIRLIAESTPSEDGNSPQQIADAISYLARLEDKSFGRPIGHRRTLRTERYDTKVDIYMPVLD